MQFDFKKVMFGVVIIICVVAIAMAVYMEVYKPEDEPLQNTVQPEDKIAEPAKIELNSLLTNELHLQGYDTSTVQKLDTNQDIVYMAYNVQDKKDEKYEINIHLPVVNISGNVANEYNKITQNIFANKANDIMANASVYTIYTIDYVAYVNDDILSVVIEATLKEGDSPQRIIVQTYNYDLKTNQDMTLSQLIERKGLDKENINNQIKQVVESANKQSEDLKQLGYTVYTRDLESDIYNIDNVNSYLLGENGKLYIIYAYGNNNFTSEMDIIRVEE